MKPDNKQTDGMLLVSLVKDELLGEKCTDPNLIDEDTAKRILNLARLNRLSYMAAERLLTLKKWPPETEQKLKDAVYSSAIKSQIQEADTQKIYNALDEAKIPYIPLKGIAIKDLYPDPSMRQSHDADILIKKTDTEKADAALLKAGINRMDIRETKHDHHYQSGSTMLELHYLLVEDYVFPCAFDTLNNAWEYAVPANKGSRYNFNDAFRYLYTVAHIAKHLKLGGGCGIRSFADIWLLLQIPHNEEERQKLLKKTGFAEFAAAAESLSQVFFGNKEMTEDDKILMDIVFKGWLFGNSKTINESLTAVNKQNKLQYLQYRIFPPIDYLKRSDPDFMILEKKPWLYFNCAFKRIAKQLKKNDTSQKLKDVTDIKADDLKVRKELYKRFGFTE